MLEASESPPSRVAQATQDRVHDAVRVLERMVTDEGTPNSNQLAKEEHWVYGEQRTWHQPTASMKKPEHLLELFAGVGGLTAAVERTGAKTMRPLDFMDPTYMSISGFDLCRLSDFKAILKMVKKRNIRWLHCAPPCSTFSRARKWDGGPPPLRSDEHPDGLAPKHKRSNRVTEANILVQRTAQLCKAITKGRGLLQCGEPRG